MAYRASGNQCQPLSGGVGVHGLFLITLGQEVTEKCGYSWSNLCKAETYPGHIRKSDHVQMVITYRKRLTNE